MKFRKKPVLVEARQLTDEDSIDTVLAWIRSNGGHAQAGEHSVAAVGGRDAYPFDGLRSIVLHTLDGSMWADPQDWVIRGAHGEFYRCRPDVFEATHEPAEDGAA